MAPRSAIARARSSLASECSNTLTASLSNDTHARDALARPCEPGGSLRDSEGARGAERAGELELLVGEALGRLLLREGKVSKSGVRSPREVTGTHDMCACCQPADAQKVGEPFFDPSLRDSQATTGKPEHGSGK